MEREFSEKEAKMHDKLYDDGWALIEQIIFAAGQDQTGNITLNEKKKLNKAITCFNEALKINPDGWSSMWALGKIYQRIKDHDIALKWFKKAFEINPENPDVSREAGIVALEIGNIEDAVFYCKRSLDKDPNDYGLICNLALAYLLAGDDEKSEAAIKFIDMNKEDKIISNVKQLIEEVISGKRPRPKKISEVSIY